MIIAGSAQLDRLLADGKISEQDADEVRRFTELLTKLSPPGRHTPEGMLGLADYYDGRDPEGMLYAHRLRHKVAGHRARVAARATSR